MSSCASWLCRKEAYRLRACFTCPRPPLLVLEGRQRYVGSKRSHAVGEVPAEGSLSSRTRFTCPRVPLLVLEAKQRYVYNRRFLTSARVARLRLVWRIEHLSELHRFRGENGAAGF